METIKILAHGLVRTKDLIRITKIHARGVTKKEKADGRWRRFGGTLVFATDDKDKNGRYSLGFVATDGRYLLKASDCGEVRFEKGWEPCPLRGGKGWQLWLHTEDLNAALGESDVAPFEICERIVDGKGGEQFVRFGDATVPLKKDDYPNFWMVMPKESALTPIRRWAITNPKYMQKVLDFVCEGCPENPAWGDVKVPDSGAPLVWDYRGLGRYAALMPIQYAK